ncbi:hypothetical protein STVA_07340 [Allostella vacuolata]|nr:hypothetical protein STVA_07340 [Stella vacuolata]
MTDTRKTDERPAAPGHATDLPISGGPRSDPEPTAAEKEDDARLDEAGIESMVASDPPAHSSPSAGAPFPRKGTR